LANEREHEDEDGGRLRARACAHRSFSKLTLIHLVRVSTCEMSSWGNLYEYTIWDLLHKEVCMSS
jgi:hypothetical protein